MADVSANQPDSASSTDLEQNTAGGTQPAEGMIARQAPRLLGDLPVEPLPVPTPAVPVPATKAPRPRRAVDWRRLELALSGVLYAGLAVIALTVTTGAVLALIGFGPFDGVSTRAFVSGAQLRFGQGGNATAMLGRGWGRKDGEGGWSNSAVSDLTIPVAAVGTRAMTMQIRFDTRVDQRDPRLDLQILAEGVTVFRQTYTASGPQIINLNVPLRRPAENTGVLVTFVQDNANDARFDDGNETLRLRAMTVSFAR